MCCLNYERLFYLEILDKFPPVESEIQTPKGTAVLDKIDVFNEEAILKYSREEGGDEYVRMGLEEIKELTKNMAFEKNEKEQS